MKYQLKLFVKKILGYIDVAITTPDNLQQLYEYKSDFNNLLKYPINNKEKLLSIISLVDKSKSQLKQDLFVLAELDFKRNGFFVEFGATDGIELSNSYLLEKEFGWNGILAEPAKCWHKALKQNRSCNIETDCVWIDSDSVLNFNEVVDAELSTIDSFNNSDLHYKARKNGVKYNVNSISLVDLLDKYNAPKIIDYISIDTEGSEFEILKHFDFEKYQFKVISCEHNYSPNRKKIADLLCKLGYVRKYPSFSKWDDWYVKNEH